MANQQEKKTRNWLWFAIAGFVFGVIGVVLATLITMLAANQPITWDNFVLTIINTPLLWLLSAAPFVFAILLGYLGAREDRIYRLRRELETNRERSQAEIQQLRARQSQMEEVLETTSESDQQHADDLQALQVKYSTAEERFEQTEMLISRGKRQWEATFDAVQDLLLITNEKDVVVRCNQATTRAFQTDYSGIIGKSIAELFVGAEGQWDKPVFQKTEAKFSNPEGWYEITSNPLQLEEGKYGNVYIIRDITERKQATFELQLQKQYYKTLFKNSPVAIVTVKDDQTVIDCNPAFESLFGYKVQDIRGKVLDEFIAPEDLVQEAQALTEVAAKGEFVRHVTQRMSREGTRLDVEVLGIPVVVGGKQLGVLGMYHDLSALDFPPEEKIPPKVVERKPDRVTAIEGIGPVYAEKLGSVGIKTTADLLDAAGSRRGRENLAKETGISTTLILSWVNRADLMRLPGVGEEYSDLLEAAGVDTVKELRNRNPENLHQALIKTNDEKSLVRREPSLAEVAGWVAAAREFEPRVTY